MAVHFICNNNNNNKSDVRKNRVMVESEQGGEKKKKQCPGQFALWLERWLLDEGPQV